MKRVILFFIFLSAGPSIAGDYMLTVANDDNSSPCAEKSRESFVRCEAEYNGCTSWPLKTAAEVSDSLRQYFSGQEPEIGILRAAFANGHLHFCGNEEVLEVYKTLLLLKKAGVKHEPSHLDDFIRKLEKLKD